jgi:Beta-propeller repeat
VRPTIVIVSALLISVGSTYESSSVLLAAKQARAAVTLAPQFQLDPAWPKQPFPNKWIIGNVIGVAVDPRDHVWILHRPSGLTDGEKAASLNPPAADCCIPAPPVIEFDQAGALVQAWGGPSDGSAWPKPGGEHGLSIDHKGNVWVGNLNDSHLLKFTPQGKFLLQIGRPGAGKTSSSDLTALGGATGSVDPKTNELYVADGYQHRRVIILDADTGAYKRHWGAYGTPPDDADATKYVPDPGAPLPKHFDTVTCARVSHDGLVYVCDRANHRFQVFKTDGTFVAEKVISPRTIQGTVHDIAFSHDPEQRFLYVPDPRNAKVFILRRTDLEIVGSFGHAGHFPGGLTNGSSVAVDSKGNLYVGEGADGKRVQRFLYKGLRPASTQE